MGTPTVNADIEVNVPKERWVLLVRGPGLGPAVLFWSFLLVVSVGLSRTKLTPLSTLRWLLLALGLSQVPIPAIVFVFAWLLFMGWRESVLGGERHTGGERPCAQGVMLIEGDAAGMRART